jgi:hypothetical protein
MLSSMRHPFSTKATNGFLLPFLAAGYSSSSSIRFSAGTAGAGGGGAAAAASTIALAADAASCSAGAAVAARNIAPSAGVVAGAAAE